VESETTPSQSFEAWHGVEEVEVPTNKVPLTRVVTIIDITDAGPPVPYEVTVPIVDSHWANMIP